MSIFFYALYQIQNISFIFFLDIDIFSLWKKNVGFKHFYLDLNSNHRSEI
jgi:hypothetical protein